MLKLLKRAMLGCLALCLALGLCVTAAACGPEEPEKEEVTYTVTVTCEEANALFMVSVQLMDGSGKSVTGDAKNLKNGSVSFTLEAGEYTVNLVSTLVGEGKTYTYEAVKVTKDKPNATVPLVRNQEELPPEDTNPNAIEYRIKVEYPDGTPLANALVQLCVDEEGGFCTAESADENGVAIFMLDPNVYQIHILSAIPDGYTFDGEKYLTTDAGGTFTVVLDAE